MSDLLTRLRQVSSGTAKPGAYMAKHSAIKLVACPRCAHLNSMGHVAFGTKDDDTCWLCHGIGQVSQAQAQAGLKAGSKYYGEYDEAYWAAQGRV